MALRGLKIRTGAGIRKSSYYVWFLGAHECGGLRGDEYIKEPVQILLHYQSDLEPIKVTLQVSSKGLKILQNGGHPSKHGTGSAIKNKITDDAVKHFIPEHSITYVRQEPPPNDDVVACILLLYDPVTKCPVHVHAYRCDSVETATLLRKQLQTLVDHPENERKFSELEVRLRTKGLLNSQPLKKVSEPEVDSAETDRDNYALLDEKTSNLYNSLAAELREKLNNTRNHGPLLLPPRDYDTMHRKKGNLENVGQRRCLQKIIVGNDVMTKSPELSSGKSSGIGSDEAPSSPTHDRSDQLRLPKTAPDSSSEDEWRKSNHLNPRRHESGNGGVRARIRELQACSKSLPLPSPQFPSTSNHTSPEGRMYDKHQDAITKHPKHGISKLKTEIGHAVPHHFEPLPMTLPNYQELPQSKRYPGLDRETARVYNHQQTQHKTGKHMADVPLSQRPRDRYSVSQTPSKASNVKCQRNAELINHNQNSGYKEGTSSSSYRQKQRSQPQQDYSKDRDNGQNMNDEKRFYRYRTTEVDLCHGQQSAAPNVIYNRF